MIGGWRTRDEAGRPVDAAGTTAGGEPVDGLEGLRRLLLKDAESFPRTVTAKLLSYALGRRLEYDDQPVVREIVRRAGAENYRWSALITGIVESAAFAGADSAKTGNAKAVAAQAGKVTGRKRRERSRAE